MGAEAAEMNKEPSAAGEASSGNGKVSDDGENKVSMGSDAGSKPDGGGKLPKGGMTVDEQTASTLTAAIERLQSAQRRDEKKRTKGNGGCFVTLSPKRLLSKLRDVYVDSCITASEKGDLADMMAGHSGWYYGENLVSRQMSERRDRERDEMLQASLSRQVSRSLSRQHSVEQSQSGQVGMINNASTGISGLSRQSSAAIPVLNRQISTGIPGLNRQTSSGVLGLNRQTSTGIAGLTGSPSRLGRLSSTGRNSVGRSASSRKQSNLFSGGREQFLQQQAPNFNAKPGLITRKVSSVPENDVKVETPRGAMTADNTKDLVE